MRVLSQYAFVVVAIWGTLFADPQRVRSQNISPRQEGGAQILAVTIEVSVVVIETDTGKGSGFVVGDGSFIATNYHVIEGAKSAKVILRDKTVHEIAGVAVYSPGKDIALLRLKERVSTKALQLGKLPEKGARVYAFGAPKGLAGSVSDGIVSAIRSGAELSELLKDSLGINAYEEGLGYDLDATWIQTTAPISPGNSGGPLVNESGEVIGICTWARADGQNLNFATAASDVQKLLSLSNESITSLDSLPHAKRGGVRSSGPANGEKTLAYWNRICAISQNLFDEIKRARTPSKTNRAQATYLDKLAGMCDKYARDLKAESLSEVDTDLALVASVDARAAGSIASALRRQALVIRSGYGGGGLTDDLEAYIDLNGEIVLAYDVLRIKLTEKYKLDFPAMQISQQLKKVQDRKPVKKTPEELEHAAKVKIKNARQLLASNMGTSRAIAIKWLREVINEFPGTRIAEDARHVLDHYEKMTENVMQP